MKKKSIKKSCQDFKLVLYDIEQYIDMMLGDTRNSLDISRIYSYSIIEVYREFEEFVLSCLIAAINHDMTSFAKKKNIKLPKHLSESACEYLILGNSYFDSRNVRFKPPALAGQLSARS